MPLPDIKSYRTTVVGIILAFAWHINHNPGDFPIWLDHLASSTFTIGLAALGFLSKDANLVTLFSSFKSKEEKDSK